jgi:hypothetical protein
MEAKSFRGKSVDMNALLMKHEKQVALGNAKMNARGDIIGKGGKVIRKREDLIREYHDQDPKAVKQVSIHSSPKEDRKVEEEFAEMSRPSTPAKSEKKTKKNDIKFS